jgi:hypothetical protein
MAIVLSAGMAYATSEMAQSAPPPRDRDEAESPAKRLVLLLERHGLEDSLRDILESLEARRLGSQRAIRAEVLGELLEGQAPLTEQELEQARREWQG